MLTLGDNAYPSGAPPISRTATTRPGARSRTSPIRVPETTSTRPRAPRATSVTSGRRARAPYYSFDLGAGTSCRSTPSSARDRLGAGALAAEGSRAQYQTVRAPLLAPPALVGRLARLRCRDAAPLAGRVPGGVDLVLAGHDHNYHASTGWTARAGAIPAGASARSCQARAARATTRSARSTTSPCRTEPPRASSSCDCARATTTSRSSRSRAAASATDPRRALLRRAGR